MPADRTSHGLTRRSTLLAGAALAPAWFLGTALGAPSPARAATASDFARVRSQWHDTLIGDLDTSDPVISTYVQSLADTANGLWSTLDTSASTGSPPPDSPRRRARRSPRPAIRS